MEQALLILLGGALTVVGGFFQHRWADDRQRQHWERERNETRLFEAAHSLASLQNLLAGRHLVNLLHLPGSDEVSQRFAELQEKAEEWKEMSDSIRRIGILNRELADDVNKIMVKSGELFRITSETYLHLMDPSKHSDRSSEAEKLRLESLVHIGDLADRLATS